MDKRLHIGLFNDSFPPVIDGVAQAVKNYATVLQRRFCDVTVATPNYKDVKDDYPFDVLRYPSFPAGQRIGYRVGNCFSPSAIRKLRRRQFDLLHIHSPFVSSVLVARVNTDHRLPVVLTYHTKFEIDIEKRAGQIPFSQPIVQSFVRHNLNAADEIWAVSHGCGASMRAIGYEGDYRVVENGTDFPYGKADAAAVEQLRDKYGVKPDQFVFLFVGRMMWYKNIRLILDALKILRGDGMDFRAFLIGGGFDAEDIRAYAENAGLQGCVTFTGPIYDREYLRVFYSAADLFLFPSTYDTSGIVVKEAAACDCPSLLIRDSCAAEGVQDGIDGYLAEENAQDCAAVLRRACGDRSALAATHAAAGKNLYLSWDTAVEHAYARYREILENWPGHPANDKA